MLCELGILYKETPFGEKESSRKTTYGISDFMFRFWYRYVFTNRTLIETGAQEAVWAKRILPDYSHYMGLVFEKVCKDYLSDRNAKGQLPFLFTSIGRWWGTDPVTRKQIEIELIANDGKDYLISECKWRNEKLDIGVLRSLVPFSVEAGDCYCSDKEMRGRGFTSPWVWLSSNDLVSNITGKKLENSAFDVGDGRPKIYFMALNRKLLGGFCYEGDCYEFNFSKLWTYCRTDFDYEETEDEIIWHVNQETFTAAIEYDIHCFKKDMLFIKYEDPDGRKRHNRLWNGGNGTGRIKLYKKQGGKRILVDDVTTRYIGCEYGEYGHYDEAGKYITERP